MSLNFTVQPGKIWVEPEKVTIAKLNQTAVPVITAEGTISPGDMAQADYSTVMGPGAYVYGLATLTGANYAVAFDPAVTSYTDGLWLAIKVDASNPAAPTLDAGAGVKPLYTAGGTRVPDAGELPANAIVQLRYNASLNAAAGGWQITGVVNDRVQPEFAGASAQRNGERGLVPAPAVGQQDYFLRAAGGWASITAIVDARLAVTSNNTLPLYLAVNY